MSNRKTHAYHVSNQDETLIHFTNPNWHNAFQVRITSDQSIIRVGVYIDDKEMIYMAFDAAQPPSAETLELIRQQLTPTQRDKSIRHSALEGTERDEQHDAPWEFGPWGKEGRQGN